MRRKIFANAMFNTAGNLRVMLLIMKTRRKQPLKMQNWHKKKGNSFFTKLSIGREKKKLWLVRNIDNT